MQNSINEYILFLLVVIILSIIGYIIYKLYNNNLRLKSILKSNLEKNAQLEDDNLELNIKNNNLEKSLVKLEELELLENSYYQLKGSFEALQTELQELKEALNAANSELETLKITKSQNATLQEQLKEKEGFIKSLESELSTKFSNIANKIFEDKQTSFLKQSDSQLKLLLEPFNQELNSFKTQVEKINSTQSQSINMLRGELLQIKELNLTLSKEANALVNALKNDSKVQGNWGELILERALESCGLKEGLEYSKEKHFKGENGNLRADIVLHLPEDKNIVIDAKVSLKSYSEILKLQEPSEIAEAKKRHIISIKRHIDTLATKQYHKIDGLKAPEFTLMFIPIEGAYLMALEIDSSIFEYAFERGVAVVTPTTLLTTLKTVSTLWRLANHDKNMEKLALEAGSLHDKFALFLEDFNTIEQRLEQANNSWQSAKSRLISGNGNLHSKIKKIGELSSKSKKSLPEIIDN